MKNKYFKRIIEFTIFFLICLLCLEISSKVFLPKWLTEEDNFERYIIDGFHKEKKNTLDIIFLGNSDTYDAISPMELWNDYGISSYNYSNPGTRTVVDYYNLKSALERQNPKYVFLSIDSIFQTTKPSHGNLAKSASSMKFSKTKIELFLNKDYYVSPLVKASYIFPVIRFHSRYNDLNKDDFLYLFKKAHMPTKGFVICTTKVPLKNTNYMNKPKKNEIIPKKNKKYLEKIIDLLNKRNIELILLETPSADSWNYNRHNAVKEYAKSKNLKFYDLNVESIGIDWENDTKDGGDHMNINGALKVTKSIGKYINDNLEVKNHKKNKKYEKWNKEYKEYQIMKEQALQVTNSSN